MNDLLTQIENIVGPEGVLHGDDARARSGDWLGRTPCLAKAIVRPENTDETAAIVKLCNEHAQPIVPAGGLTGLARGAVANETEIMLSFERMKAIEEVDPVGRTMTVQTGAPLQAVQEAAGDYNMMFPIDLGARGSATIGGNIATNAGGNQVIRYGMMRNQVLGLEVVLADGAVLSSMNKVLKNNSGYDLKHIFIGSEGTLGLVTRAVLRLSPQPKSENTALLAIDDFSKLTTFFEFVGERFADTLNAFEVMWKEHYQIVAVASGRHQAPMEAGHAFYVVVETTGVDERHDSEHFTTVLSEAIEAGLVADAVIASSKAQRGMIWAIREDIEALAAVLLPGAVFDVSLPISAMDAYTRTITREIAAAWPDNNRVVIFGHLGDGNLHIGATASPWTVDVHNRIENIVYGPLAAVGGAISAEHGVGLEKRNFLNISRTEEEIALMRMLKGALDPKNLFNPGKVLAI
ncbi:MAG: FAD-binding oxidoreductase [Pseudomonadota bacterium]